MNSEQQQQRIMGYFIEEAREHLQTIEQGVLNLQDVLNDSESVNELFRAAHSIKGGAAMLGVGSIQHISHRLEDFFKILKENPQITVDERLKSLLLAGFDPLAELLEELQSDFKISDELTTETNNRVKPIFTEVESYLNQLVSDIDGAIFPNTTEELAIELPQELTASQELVFHQEVTTKMRDMLQLFRGTDSAESRSQLQAICNYFQEIGNNYDLRNWTNLVTQIKNAIAQPSNSYRTLAPILIRELKEAQDLVLSNREIELVVSSQLQNLLPSWFSEAEDDEVSTIFTAASEIKAEEEIVEDLEVLELETTENINDIENIDDINLFADQINEETFDLADSQEDPINQMNWMDGEYEITENQHIDGPKVGASELKSLAILFENDDIDFDAAWEDIESNETHISKIGSNQISDTHDEFADLLSQSSDDIENATLNNLGIEESSIDQLFGDFSTEESITNESEDSLFPEDVNISWNQTSEIDNQVGQASLNELTTNDLVGDDEFDDFDLDSDLDIDIIDEISDINNSTNIDNFDLTDELYNAESSDQSNGNEFIDAQDSLDNISSEEYFAELERKENAITDDVESQANEPFALTFSEEGIALLEDPFAINENLDEASLEASLNIIDDASINFNDNFFFEEVEPNVIEENISDNYSESILSTENFDNVDNSGLNIFDELGFDNDELDYTLESQEFDNSNRLEKSNIISSSLSLEEDSDDFMISEIDISDVSNTSDDLSFLIESDEFDDNSDFNISSLGLVEEDLNPSEEVSFKADFGELTDVDAINNDDNLDNLFADSKEVDDTSEIIETEDFIGNTIGAKNISSIDELESFFESNKEPQPVLISKADDFNNFSEENNTDDFFGDSEEIENNDWNDLNINDEINNETQTSQIEGGFADFDSLQIVNEEDLVSEFFDQPALSEASNLEDLFVDADEDNLTTVDNELDNDFDFDNARSLSQVDEDLTGFQEDFDFDVPNQGSTASSTIDNLVDFFQVDDDSDLRVWQSSEELIDDNLAVDNLAVTDDSEFNEFVDLNGARSEAFDFPSNEILQTKNLSSAEELNDIDDNFDFDDLESMIGDSSDMPNQEINGSFDSQVTETFINSQTSDNSDDMNFDELEALLGDPNSLSDSNSFDTFISADSRRPNASVADALTPAPQTNSDDFDELENMLQRAFAKDIGPIKTKSSTRPLTTPRKQRLTDSTMRVDVKYLDSLNNLVGELVVNRNLLEQDQERLQQFITNLLHQVQLLSDVSQRMRDQYDRSLLEASLTAGRGGRSFSFDSSFAIEGASSNSSVSSEFEGIEFDRYNTFHVLSQEIIELIVKVRESASDIEFVVGETDQVTRQLGTITTQVQDDLKQSRMVPFAQIADRLPRGIRDRALKTGKQAELEIFGRETLIDKAILEQLTDPLTHLVNNAIDHGLEDPATRQAAGKSATGKLTVRTYHQGNQTVISIGDDGAGISTSRVKQSAVSKGVRTQSEVDKLNDSEVYALLFEAGFSTAAEADEFKGRGVGLDVVKTCIDEIRGVIIVESAIGKGTTFTIRLPLTLSISKAMFCISDRARVAFPVDGFEDMVEVPQSQIVLNDKGQPCLPWRDTILPFQHLSNLLSYSRHISRSSIYGKQENDELCIIILRNDTSYLALQVDQFLGEYEIVIKQLEGPIPQPAGIAGATVLGDGRVMAIANVLELFDIASGRLRPSVSGITVQPPVEEDIAVDPTVLIVDDSITVRELLSLTFAKVGYRVEQAKDGQDAWEKLRAGLPCDMIFCDIEMPRMDGLELLSRLQKDARLKEIPVAMLTSRGADRHRQSAIQFGAKGYFTKPYLEEELLSASKRLLKGETLPI